MKKEQVHLLEEGIADNRLIGAHYMKITDGGQTDCQTHWHNFLEMELVINGSGEHIHNGSSVPIKRGLVSILRTVDYHAIKNPQNVEILSLTMRESAFSQEMLTSLNLAPHNLFCYINEDELEQVCALYRCCVAENDRLKPSETFIKNLIECIMIYLIRRIQPNSPNPLAHKSQNMHAAVNYLHSHFRESPSLEQLAAIVHYTPTHFSRTFRREFNRSYSEYLNDLKIAYAKQLLSETDVRVIDVGFQSGFNSYNNFYTTFKRYTAISPADYRRACTGELSNLGHSWRFALINTDIETNPAYVYVRARGLKANTRYSFSYLFSNDFKIHPHTVTLDDKEVLPLNDFNEKLLNSRKRLYSILFDFTTSKKGDCLITLKMGKGLNNPNCIWRYTILSRIVLKEGDISSNSPNLAEAFSHVEGDVAWSDNSCAYPEHIDK